MLRNVGHFWAPFYFVIFRLNSDLSELSIPIDGSSFHAIGTDINPTYTIPEDGLYYLHLMITSGSGCDLYLGDNNTGLLFLNAGDQNGASAQSYYFHFKKGTHLYKAGVAVMTVVGYFA